ncbi:hypothetical protein C0Q70_19337 [Pomacea canaliculata]|uniref:Uncharacterized protein n=1 Tax=Pomacea canaliculata TaxID=400727 RepID=A0A2T7NJ22_POMCA|nr:hypothetical protein C0Q70_19337 [Pomacea canaliculata]
MFSEDNSSCLTSHQPTHPRAHAHNDGYPHRKQLHHSHPRLQCDLMGRIIGLHEKKTTPPFLVLSSPDKRLRRGRAEASLVHKLADGSDLTVFVSGRFAPLRAGINTRPRSSEIAERTQAQPLPQERNKNETLGNSLS